LRRPGCSRRTSRGSHPQRRPVCASPIRCLTRIAPPASANTIADFLDTSKAALLEPPQLTGSGNTIAGELDCKPVDPVLKVLPAPSPKLSHVGRLILHVEGYKRRLHRGRVVARRKVAHISTHREHVILRALHRHQLPPGAYTVRARRGGRTLAHRALRIR
jgi:hypothetical protein